VEIFFRTQKLEKTCNSEKVMKKDLGDQMAKKLQQRLFELKAADSLAEISHLPPPRLHELTGNRKGQYSIDLIHPFRLIFIVANELPAAGSGGIDRGQVTEIEIIAIEDTH
jgi:proteic killer suppression protein